jgi:hypothetical protein
MKTYIYEVWYSDGLHAHQGIKAVSRKEAEAELDELLEVGKINSYTYLRQMTSWLRISHMGS